MRLGTTLPSYCTGDHLVPASTIREWASWADSVGFDGLWTLDHFVKPALYNTSVLDPLTALSHAAAVTGDIDLGTSILILPIRHAATVASQALTLEHLAEGHLTLGMGIGYVPEEFAVTGVPIRERGPRMSEGIEVLQALFAGEASFDGRFHSFEDVRIDPVLDDPPSLLAGGGSRVDEDGNRTIPEPILDRILATGGWIAAPTHPETVAEEWELIATYAREQGVDPDSLRRVMLNYTHVVEGSAETALEEQRTVFEGLFSPKRGFDHARKTCLVGTIDDIADRLAAYEAVGFDEVLMGPAASDPTVLNEQMERVPDLLLSTLG